MAAEPWSLLDTDLWADLAVAARPTLSGLIGEARPAWHAQAACRARPDLDWFAAGDLAATTAICATCPVAEPCAAAGRGERHGVWAGKAKGLVTRPVVVGDPPMCAGCGQRGVYCRRLCPACYQRDRKAARRKAAAR